MRAPRSTAVAIAPTLLALQGARAEPGEAELAGSAYGATPIGHLPRMSSGLSFSERYDGKDGLQDPQPTQERDAFWRGVLQSLGGSTAD